MQWKYLHVFAQYNIIALGSAAVITFYFYFFMKTCILNIKLTDWCLIESNVYKTKRPTRLWSEYYKFKTCEITNEQKSSSNVKTCSKCSRTILNTFSNGKLFFLIF